MNRMDWNLWSNITFKTQTYRKNFDLINENEKYITECDGTISEIRINKRIPPRPVGEYGFSVWNIKLGNKFNVDFNKLIKEHAIENTYDELIDVINKNEININDYKKIVLIHTLVIHEDYRKRGVVDEFIEMIYRDFYDDDVAIIILVKPFQDNPIDADFYFNRKVVMVRDSLDIKEAIGVPAKEYYSLNDLVKNDDTEIIEYKLFAIANRCGFNRINESHLFIYNPDKTINRMETKHLDKKNNFTQ